MRRRDAILGPATRQWFGWYCRYALRKHFHRALLYEHSPTWRDAGGPWLIACQHASFWDGILLHFALARLLGRVRVRCLIDAEQIARHPFFLRVGGVPLDRRDPRRAAATLRTEAAALERSGGVLVIFPQGRLRPADARPLGFEHAGLRRLARPGVRVVPAAVRYEFWEEQRPEAMLALGPPAATPATPGNVEQAVTAQADHLAAAALARQPGQTLLHGRPSINRRRTSRTPQH